MLYCAKFFCALLCICFLAGPGFTGFAWAGTAQVGAQATSVQVKGASSHSVRSVTFAVGQKMSGRSAWYGQRAHGNRTASGKVFDSTKLTAAHRTLPFGTMVKVTNIKNKKSVLVQVTDRGPTSKKLIIDISRQAAIDIGMFKQGIGRVTVEIVSLPLSYTKKVARR